MYLPAWYIITGHNIEYIQLFLYKFKMSINTFLNP